MGYSSGSSGSESVNTAPSTPLASPTPSKEASGSKKHSAKSHSKGSLIYIFLISVFCFTRVKTMVSCLMYL